MYALIAIASVSMMDKRSLNRRPDFKDYMDSTPAIFLNIFKLSYEKIILCLILLMTFESISAKDLRNQLAIDIPGVMTW